MAGRGGAAARAPSVGAFAGAVETGDGAEMSGAGGGVGAVAFGGALALSDSELVTASSNEAMYVP